MDNKQKSNSYTLDSGCHPLVDTYAPQPVHSPGVGGAIIGC